MTTDDPGVLEHLANLQLKLQATLETLTALAGREQVIDTPEQLEAFEREVNQTTDQAAGLIVGLALQRSVASPDAQAKAKALVKAQPKLMKNQGRRQVTVRGTRGDGVVILTSYFTGKGRAKRGKGFYPGLARLGIAGHCTPLLAADVAQTAVICSSFEEASEVLAQRGLVLDAKTIGRIAYEFGRRARLVRHLQDLPRGPRLAGRRVVIGTDGGRLRIRKNKPGPKTAKKRTRYSSDWKEPKLLVIYVIDSEGEQDRTVSALIDGTMQGPDAVFALIEHYLTSLGITEADTVVLVADAAPWIWNRIPGLIERLKLESERVVLIVDFYHAVEHLGKVAALRKKWTPAERKRWITRQRRVLLAGKIDQVIAAVEELCRGRASKAVAKERDYFRRHRDAMNYAAALSRKVPIGSGAVESAIRRVVNLRLKGPGIFWRREHAELMLMLRSFHKAGRWDALKQAASFQPLPAAA